MYRNYKLNNEVEYYYIELDKFRKQNVDMKEKVNQWLAFLDMERGELLEMAKKENKEIKEAVETYEVLTGDEEVKRLAEIRLMSHLEEQSALATARQRGTEEGLKQGKEEGLKYGAKKMAKKLIEKKMTIEEIEEITELSREEIEEISKNI